MDEKTTEAVREMAQIMLESLKEGKDFVLREAPLVVQEYVLLKRVEATLYAAVGVACLVFVAFAARKIHATVKAADDETLKDADVLVVVEWGIAGVLSAVSVVWIADNVGVALTAWLAPRILVLDYVAKFL